MKTIILILLVVPFPTILSFGQNVTPIEQPDSVSTEVNAVLYPSRIFIPIEIKETIIKSLIDNATPESQRIKDESRTREINFSFKITDRETEFNNSTITHNLRLTKGDGSYKWRNWGRYPWPIRGRWYGPWFRVDCDDIRGNAEVNISISLEHNYQVKALGEIKAKIDNIQCAQFNVTGIARAFGWHDFKQSINKNLENEFKKIDLKSAIADVWKQIQIPHKVSNDLYLFVKPETITYNDLKFSDGSGKTGVGLSFFATTGDKNDSIKWHSDIPLPDLVKNPTMAANKIELNLPLNLSYDLLNKVAKDRLTGRVIKGKNRKGREKRYAKIDSIEIYGSKEYQNGIVVGLKTKVYRTIFKKEHVPIYIHAKLDYDTLQKRLFITEYKLDSKTENGLYNISLEAIANKIAYSKIIPKLYFDVSNVINEQKAIANRLLENKIEITTGVKLSGVVETLEVKQIIAQPDRLSCLFILTGTTNIEILELK